MTGVDVPEPGSTRSLLEGLEPAGDEGRTVGLAFLAAGAVRFDEAELNAARRRALLLLAAGGDPRRELELDGRAVRALAADLDDPSRRAELDAALAALAPEAAGLPAVEGALAALRADDDLAWRALAAALLADELTG